MREDICKLFKTFAAGAPRGICFVATSECDTGYFASVHPENPGGQYLETESLPTF
jgi:hypothetical protein